MTDVEISSREFDRDEETSMMGMAATHVRCSRCGNLTEITEGEQSASAGCSHCPDGAPEALTAVAVVPCPDDPYGERAALGDRCRDDHHDASTGGHIVEVD